MGDPVDALTTIFTESYYWITVVMMFLIHAGFCTYEVGASRRKNVLHTLMKNTMLIPLVTVTFFFFGWYVYFAFPNVPFASGGFSDASFAEPWDEFMGAHMQDRILGVFWAAFLLFSWTTASIVSGAVIERIKTSAFLIFAVLIGSFTWILDAAWGWHPGGWMVQILGYHDAYASGVVHAIAGGSALAILCVLGPRIGKFGPNGEVNEIKPHNPWLVTVGLFLIFTGFWGFYAACNVPIIDIGGEAGTFFSATNIYLDADDAVGDRLQLPDVLLGRSDGGLHRHQGRSVLDLFRRPRRHHRGLCRQRSLSPVAGALHRCGRRGVHDLHAPLGRAAVQDRRCGRRGRRARLRWVLRRRRVWLRALGLSGREHRCLATTPRARRRSRCSTTPEGLPQINPVGQILGAIIMFWVLGFLPCYVLARVLQYFKMLRVPREVELAGLDTHQLGDAYPYHAHQETAFEKIERTYAKE